MAFCGKAHQLITIVCHTMYLSRSWRSGCVSGRLPIGAANCVLALIPCGQSLLWQTHGRATRLMGCSRGTTNECPALLARVWFVCFKHRGFVPVQKALFSCGVKTFHHLHSSRATKRARSSRPMVDVSALFRVSAQRRPNPVPWVAGGWLTPRSVGGRRVAHATSQRPSRAEYGARHRIPSLGAGRPPRSPVLGPCVSCHELIRAMHA